MQEPTGFDNHSGNNDDALDRPTLRVSTMKISAKKKAVDLTRSDGLLRLEGPHHPYPIQNANSMQLGNEKNLDVFNITYTFYHVYREKKDSETITQIQSEFPKDCTVEEAIEEIIQPFNEELTNKGLGYRLGIDANDYNLYFAKKTGQHKPDFPALAGTQVLSRTTAKNFTLVEKNPKAIIKVNSYTKGKSDSGRSPTAGSRGSIKLEGSNGMINPGVPVADSTRNTENTVNGVFEYNQPEDTEEETKTCCWCFKISSKKSKPKQDNDISMQLNKDNSLQQPLVQRA